MQTAARSREPDPRSFAARKGHVPQLSISDDSRHVTEAIGYMYEDDSSPTSPLANRNSQRSDKSSSGEYDLNLRRASLNRKPLPDLKMSFGEKERLGSGREKNSTSPPKVPVAWDPISGASRAVPVTSRGRSPSDTATTQFPLNDIDYESSPAAVAQELSNLQALRRMSMDVAATGDPDLPQLNSAAIPSAPSASSSEDDSARLFWVPARLHPELAPKEFKSFLESKAEQIKRRSGELSSFSSPSTSRSSSLSTSEVPGGLRRKKSMLSKEIESSIGYQDGAERLERKRSLEKRGGPIDPNLQDLESAMPRTSLDSKIDEETGDIILPSVPGSSLKRSTRTKYQKDRRRREEDGATYAQRAARRAAGVDRESPTPLSDNDVPALPGFSSDFPNLASTLKDPNTASSSRPGPKINFSRPAERNSSPPAPDHGVSKTSTFESIIGDDAGNRSSTQSMPDPRSRRVHSPPLVGQHDRPIPQIVESPPPEDRPVRTSSMRPPPTNVYTIPSSAPEQQPEPVQEPPKVATPKPAMPIKQSSVTLSSGRRSPNRPDAVPPQNAPSQSLDQPSSIPGQENHTANLSYIPTLTVDKRAEGKKKEEKKSSWSWLLGEKERDRDRDVDKPKAKISKPPQTHDNTRLDVLQTSIDGGAKGRESLVLDRDNLKLDEERKKDSLRKTSSSSEKKEREGIFASLFGGKKHKAEKEAQKKLQERLSPEPRSKEMRPDIDYNWTRFSILEERAIYRMAHIKLANPRRALYSQVLLSNFMYSYLAKVQQMHPQMNLPTSAKQQRKQKEQEKLQQQQQPEEFTQYQRYQQQQAQQQAVQQPSSQPPNQGQPYTPQHGYEGDASAMYDYEYATNGNSAQSEPEPQRPRSRGNKHIADPGGDHSNQDGRGYDEPYGSGGNAYYHQQYQQQHSRQDDRYNGRHEDNDMW